MIFPKMLIDCSPNGNGLGCPAVPVRIKGFSLTMAA
jgi:hypothetical protein